MRVRTALVAPDKFKGSLPAAEVAEAIRRGIASVRPEWRVVCLPIADGGEGTTDVVAAAWGVPVIHIDSSDANGRPRTGEAAIRGSEAVFEMATAAGLRWIEPGERDPWRANTFGVGQILRKLRERGVRDVRVGLGGSATNDAGVGMAAALGFGFLDKNGSFVDPVPREFHRIARVLPPAEPTALSVTALCDVENPLLGTNGASVVYGPQKGVRDVHGMDAALGHVATIIERDLGVCVRHHPGAGAAGGLGFGLLAFLGANLAPGFDALAKMIDLPAAVSAADVVVTGEGRLDHQTLFGKGPAGVARMARSLGKTTLAVCGSVEEGVDFAESFDAVAPLVSEGTPLSAALAEPERWIEARARKLARTWMA